MSSESIQTAIGHLQAGEIIAYPTDTLFGLGVDALNTEAIKKLYQLKQRNQQRPMSIMVPLKNWEQWVKSIPASAEKLAQKFFPGAITLIMTAGDNIPKILTQYTNGTIGVRVPNHPTCLELLDSFGGPIITTSANLSNHPSAKDPDTIIEYFGDGVSYILTDGPKPGGVASTVVDVSENEPIVLRVGIIPEFSIWRSLR